MCCWYGWVFSNSPVFFCYFKKNESVFNKRGALQRVLVSWFILLCEFPLPGDFGLALDIFLHENNKTTIETTHPGFRSQAKGHNHLWCLTDSLVLEPGNTTCMTQSRLKKQAVLEDILTKCWLYSGETRMLGGIVSHLADHVITWWGSAIFDQRGSHLAGDVITIWGLPYWIMVAAMFASCLGKGYSENWALRPQGVARGSCHRQTDRQPDNIAEWHDKSLLAAARRD